MSTLQPQGLLHDDFNITSFFHSLEVDGKTPSEKPRPKSASSGSNQLGYPRSKPFSLSSSLSSTNTLMPLRQLLRQTKHSRIQWQDAVASTNSVILKSRKNGVESFTQKRKKLSSSDIESDFSSDDDNSDDDNSERLAEWWDQDVPNIRNESRVTPKSHQLVQAVTKSNCKVNSNGNSKQRSSDSPFSDNSRRTGSPGKYKSTLDSPSSSSKLLRSILNDSTSQNLEQASIINNDRRVGTRRPAKLPPFLDMLKQLDENKPVTQEQIGYSNRVHDIEEDYDCDEIQTAISFLRNASEDLSQSILVEQERKQNRTRHNRYRSMNAREEKIKTRRHPTDDSSDISQNRRKPLNSFQNIPPITISNLPSKVQLSKLSRPGKRGNVSFDLGTSDCDHVENHRISISRSDVDRSYADKDKDIQNGNLCINTTEIHKSDTVLSSTHPMNDDNDDVVGFSDSDGDSDNVVIYTVLPTLSNSSELYDNSIESTTTRHCEPCLEDELVPKLDIELWSDDSGEDYSNAEEFSYTHSNQSHAPFFEEVLSQSNINRTLIQEVTKPDDDMVERFRDSIRNETSVFSGEKSSETQALIVSSSTFNEPEKINMPFSSTNSNEITEKEVTFTAPLTTQGSGEPDMYDNASSIDKPLEDHLSYVPTSILAGIPDCNSIYGENYQIDEETNREDFVINRCLSEIDATYNNNNIYEFPNVTVKASPNTEHIKMGYRNCTGIIMKNDDKKENNIISEDFVFLYDKCDNAHSCPTKNTTKREVSFASEDKLVERITFSSNITSVLTDLSDRTQENANFERHVADTLFDNIQLEKNNPPLSKDDIRKESSVDIPSADFETRTNALLLLTSRKLYQEEMNEAAKLGSTVSTVTDDTIHEPMTVSNEPYCPIQGIGQPNGTAGHGTPETSLPSGSLLLSAGTTVAPLRKSEGYHWNTSWSHRDIAKAAASASKKEKRVKENTTHEQSTAPTGENIRKSQRLGRSGSLETFGHRSMKSNDNTRRILSSKDPSEHVETPEHPKNDYVKQDRDTKMTVGKSNIDINVNDECNESIVQMSGLNITPLSKENLAPVRETNNHKSEFLSTPVDGIGFVETNNGKIGTNMKSKVQRPNFVSLRNQKTNICRINIPVISTAEIAAEVTSLEHLLRDDNISKRPHSASDDHYVNADEYDRRNKIPSRPRGIFDHRPLSAPEKRTSTSVSSDSNVKFLSTEANLLIKGYISNEELFYSKRYSKSNIHTSHPRKSIAMNVPTEGNNNFEGTTALEKFRPASWDDLPDELKLIIFSFLHQRDIRRSACTCRDFNRISYDHTLWKDISAIGCALTKNNLRCIGMRRPGKLNLSKCKELSTSGMWRLAQATKGSLRELRLNGCLSVDDNCLREIAPHLPLINLLDLSWCKVTDVGVATITINCPVITSISLQGCAAISDSSIHRIAAYYNNNLLNLDILGCFTITGSAVEAISQHCSSLVSLSLGQCFNVPSRKVVRLSEHIPNLRNLDLRNCKQIRDSALSAIATNCPSLVHLNISYCCLVSDDGVRDISISLGDSLLSLDLSGCVNVTEHGFLIILTKLIALTSLDVSCCNGVSSSVIESLSQYCRKLCELRINHCVEVSEESICAVLQDIPSLQRLEIQGVKLVKNPKRLTCEWDSVNIVYSDC